MPKDFNAIFQADPLAFMKKYSCKPDNDLAGNTGVKHATSFVTPSTNDYRFREMAPANRIGYLNFTKISQGTDPAQRLKTIIAQHATGQVTVTGDYSPHPTKVRSYFLPWQTNHIISLTIPQAQPGIVGAPYFFTAAINGCSVFFKGTPKNPTVLHAGGSTGQEGDPAAGAAFWRDMLQTHVSTAGVYEAEVNKVDYTVDKVKSKTFTGPTGTKDKVFTKLGTAHSRKFEAWLKKDYSNDYLIESVAPTGCVMGIRDNSGDWAFYLQENVSVTYYKFQRVKTGFFTSKKQKIDASMNVVMRPMQLTKIFPGSGHVKFTPAMDRVLKD